MFFSLQIFCLTKQGKLITLIVAVLVAPVAGSRHMTTLAHCGTKIKAEPSNFVTCYIKAKCLQHKYPFCSAILLDLGSVKSDY